MLLLQGYEYRLI